MIAFKRILVPTDFSETSSVALTYGKALAGQLMQVDVTSSQALRLSIYGVDGTVLKSGMGEGATFAGTLPVTQDYILVIGAGTQPSSYTLIVSVQ